MAEIKNGQILLSTGTVIEDFNGFFGINADLVLSFEVPILTQAERVEIADLAIEFWKRFRRRGVTLSKYIDSDGNSDEVVPENRFKFTASELAQWVGGHPMFVELLSGDILVCNDEPTQQPHNQTASTIYNRNIFGDVLICDKSEIPLELLDGKD